LQEKHFLHQQHADKLAKRLKKEQDIIITTNKSLDNVLIVAGPAGAGGAMISSNECLGQFWKTRTTKLKLLDHHLSQFTYFKYLISFIPLSLLSSFYLIFSFTTNT